MAHKVIIFVIINCICIHLCHSKPPPLINVPFPNFVLDNKKDCRLSDTNQEVIKLFKTVSCPSEAKKYSDSYFEQRDVLPCFGAYDALFNLCDFPSDKINFTTPKSFEDPETFCNVAKVVYDHIPFKYNNDNVKKWGQALLMTMKNESLCNNLCVINTEINNQCIAMVTFAQEYLRLKGIPVSNVKSSIIALANNQANNQTTTPKPISDVKNSTFKNVGNVIGNVNITNPSEFTKPTPGDSTTHQDNAKDSESTLQNEKESLNKKESLPKKPENPITNVEHGSEGTVPEPENTEKDRNSIKEVKPSDNVKSIIPTVTDTNNMPKGSQISLDEGLGDENDKTVTEDDFHGDIEEALPPEAKEKGSPARRSFLASRPISLSQNVPNSFLNHLKRTSTSHSFYEENEKPNDEEKDTVPEAEKHTIYHVGMSPAFNPMDSFSESEDSYSFTYIVTTMAALCCVYLLFHYRNKLLALALEGRKGRSSRSRGRPSSANYSKLHSNLEEAIASNVTAPTATHVLY